MRIKLFFTTLLLFVITGCASVENYGDTFTITYGTIKPFSEVQAMASDQCPSGKKPELTGVIEGELGGNQAIYKCVPVQSGNLVEKKSGSISRLSNPPVY